jgi:hypothetical protein
MAWFLWGRGDGQEVRPPAAGTYGPDSGNASSAEVSQAARHPRSEAVSPPGPLPAGGEDASPVPATQSGALAPPRAPPNEDLDGPSWRTSRLAFRPRELGKLGPYVKAGLDAARRDMMFCFTRSSDAPAPEGEDQDDAPPPPRADPAVLLLYLEAREGALDVIEARTEYRGTSAPEVVECCREVLRGLEIKAFHTVPGERYRLKYRLPR